MKNLVESQKFDDQVNQNELEDIQGGGTCSPVKCGSGYSCNFKGDFDGGDNVVF